MDGDGMAANAWYKRKERELTLSTVRALEG